MAALHMYTRLHAYTSIHTCSHSRARAGPCTALGPWRAGSADGINVYEAMKASPPWLRSLFIIWSTWDGYAIAFPGGAFRQSLIEAWMRLTVPEQAARCVAKIRSNEDSREGW